MPLQGGYSRAVAGENVAREIRSGRSQAQAVAMSLRSARRAWRARHPSGPFPRHLRSTILHRASRSNRTGSKSVCRCDAYGFPHAPGGGACTTNRVNRAGADEEEFVPTIYHRPLAEELSQWASGGDDIQVVASKLYARKPFPRRYLISSAEMLEVFARQAKIPGNVGGWSKKDARDLTRMAKHLRNLHSQPASGANRAAGKARRYYVVEQVQSGHWVQVGHFYWKRDADAFCATIGGRTQVIHTYPSAHDHPVRE